MVSPLFNVGLLLGKSAKENRKRAVSTEVPADLCQTSWKLKTMGLQVHPVIQHRILSLWMPADCHPIWTTCQLYYVPGDILYGRVGRAASIRRWLLLHAADKVQKGGVDDPRDQNAIKIGMDLWDRPSLTPRQRDDMFVGSYGLLENKNKFPRFVCLMIEEGV
ncbi:unnamed protein product [Porites lobata]|uniref:Uncharacterized protein n=1 Tax=Porites lobata TaxID=104759 RepID=A0ABN8QSJ9_9CNID|nr:unnamed protein product [Porites lobata]